MADLWCPLCDWTEPSEVDQYMASNAAAAPAVAAAMCLPPDALLSMHTHQCRHRDEQTLNRHLGMHRVDEWVQALMVARGQLVQMGQLLTARMWPGETLDTGQASKVDGRTGS